MDDVNEYAKEKIQHFVKDVIVAHAMVRQVYFFDPMRIKKLTEVYDEMKRNYDPTGPTAYDDRATSLN